VKTISLSQGLEALVDDADFEWLSQWKWHAILREERFYAARSVYDPTLRKQHRVAMHRQIAETPEGLDTDHRDGDTLNNQRANLRVATRSQNNGNTRMFAHNTSGFKGVHRAANSWRAIIYKNNRRIHLGMFPTPELAHEAYKTAALKQWGEFARI
jgi:hypothetical protein